MGPDVAKVFFNHIDGYRSVNFPKYLLRGLRNAIDSALRKISVCVNFPKAGGLWDPTYLMFWLTT